MKRVKITIPAMGTGNFGKQREIKVLVDRVEVDSCCPTSVKILNLLVQDDAQRVDVVKYFRGKEDTKDRQVLSLENGNCFNIKYNGSSQRMFLHSQTFKNLD